MPVMGLRKAAGLGAVKVTRAARRPGGLIEEGGRRRAPPFVALVAASVLLALASLALPSAPGYDPWSWLVWGRELAGLDLSTSAGPAWKPLPELFTAPLAALSEELAPEGWLVVARAGAILATALAFALARRLAGGSRAAGIAAGVGLLLVPGWIENAAVGNSEGLLVALVLLAVERALDGRLWAAFALGVLAALLRVEVWPFLAVLGAAWVRRDRAALRPVLLAAVGVAALWFGPELLGSGEPLRSAGRARVPNPGAPALAAHPALATLTTAIRLPPALALAGVGALLGIAAVRASARAPARDALVVAGGGAAWILLVAAMSELGFSGEARYLLPAAALLTVAGMAGPFGLLSALATRREGVRRVGGAALAATLALGLAVTALVRGDALRADLERVAYGAALAADLERAVARAGGAPSLVRCGPPYVGPYRGPMLAWALGVHKAEVGFEATRPGVAFRSRLGPESPLAPAGAGGRHELSPRTGLWRIEAVCGAVPVRGEKR